MKPTELKSLITSRFKAKVKRPVHIESSPGLGKTQIAAQIAKELGIGFKAVHAPLMQPEDYGFPSISQDRKDVSFIVSKEKFPMLTSDCPDSGILLIDELPQADNAGQKVLANLLQEREIHGQRLKPDWMIVSTGNRVTDRSGASRLLSHLRNRITTVELEVSLDDWCNWALEHGVKTEVISFVRFRPALLNAFDPQQELNPTPRSWVEGVSDSLGVVDSGLEFASFKGDVGEGAAAEFCAFMRIYRNLPAVERIWADPGSVDVPKDPATLYAVCGSLAHRTLVNDFANALAYVTRMPAEFSVLFIRDLIKKQPAIQSTKAFIQWATGPGAKLLT